jgi:ATP-dependent DNA helicase PIF1
LFLTGYGGTGKSHTLNTIIRGLKALGKTVLITASTGAAAINLEHGITVNAALGLGIGSGSAQSIADKVFRTPDLMDRWSSDVLVVDEISMLGAPLFELIDSVGKLVRAELISADCGREPVGGMRMILCGDFLQLAPIDQSGTALGPGSLKTFRSAKDVDAAFGKERRFCFQTAAWREARITCIELTKCYRQDDEATVRMLGSARDGCLSDEAHDAFLEVC